MRTYLLLLVLLLCSMGTMAMGNHDLTDLCRWRRYLPHVHQLQGSDGARHLYQLNIFINNNCEFFEPTARFGIRTTQNVASIFAPDSLYWESDMFANGTGAAVPKGFTVTCNRFFDYTEGKLNVAGKLIFTNCSGWLSDANPADFPNVIIPEHKHVEYIFQHATCEEKPHLYTRCTVCNEELPTEKYSVKPLGHIEIEDKEPVKGRLSILLTSLRTIGHVSG